MIALLPLRHSPIRGRGFSLVEVLLAILILGIGIISIAALFPAGIAQQRLANDDVMGPIVANNAISIIRSRVRQEDFGTFEEYQRFFNDSDVPQAYFSRTLPGDWDWMRPGFLLGEDGSTDFVEAGAIDIFSHRATWQAWGSWGGEVIQTATEIPDGWPDADVWAVVGPGSFDQLLFGIPYDASRFNASIEQPAPPDIIISQRERYYPMQTGLVDNEGKPRPQYVWDCMFRRYQGRVYVAVFVYRISANNSNAPFVVPADPDDPDYPPLPYRLDMVANGGARDVWYDGSGRARPYVLGADDANDFFANPDLPEYSWQRTRQWLLDQNNNIHRVVGVERDPDDNTNIRVELTRPLQPAMTPFGTGNITTDLIDWSAPFNDVRVPSDAPNYYYADPNTSSTDPPHCDVGVLTDLWYIPRHMEVDGVEFTLTPVFLTVKEL